MHTAQVCLPSDAHGLTVASHFVPRVLTIIEQVSVVSAAPFNDSRNPSKITHDVQARTTEQVIADLSTSSTSPLADDDVGSKPRVNDATGFVEIETRSVFQRCKPRCPCQCHVAYEGSSPRWLRGLLGSAYVRTLGLSLFGHRTCNFPLCISMSERSGSLCFRYRFPVWFLQLAIEATATWRDLNGINGTWTLRIPRILENARVYNVFLDCLHYGSRTNILELMDRECIRPNDIFKVSNEGEYPILYVSNCLVPTRIPG